MKKVSQPVIGTIPFPEIPLDQQKLILGKMEILQERIKEIHDFQEKTLSELTGLADSAITKAFRGIL